MSNTLKVNLDRVLSGSGFQTPDAYIGNTDQNIAQLVTLAQDAASEIVEQAYQELRATWSLTLTSATSYALPTDFLGFIPGTMYQTGRWDRADLPTTEATWALLSAVSSVASLPIRVRLIGGLLHVLNPQSGAVLTVEYYSKAPIYAASDGTTALTEFASDGDTWRLDDRLFQLETKWRFKKEKGLGDWQIDLQDASNRRAALRSRETSDIVPNQMAANGQPYANLWVS